MNTLSNHPENQYLTSRRKSGSPTQQEKIAYTLMCDEDLDKLVKDHPSKVKFLQPYFPGGEAPSQPAPLLLTNYLKMKKQ